MNEFLVNNIRFNKKLTAKERNYHHHGEIALSEKDTLYLDLPYGSIDTVGWITLPNTLFYEGDCTRKKGMFSEKILRIHKVPYWNGAIGIDRHRREDEKKMTTKLEIIRAKIK